MQTCINYDISFLLPTNRDEDYALRVIDSINKIPTKYTYEIVVYSLREIKEKNVKWIQESLPNGPISGFNHMARWSSGEYLVCLVDDHEVCNDFYNIIELLKGPTFKDKRLKIATIATGHAHQRIPIKGETWAGGVLVDYDVEPFVTMRFPVVHRDTLTQYLNGHIFHPSFKYHAGDLWLGYYLGMCGEPGIECAEANLYQYINLRNNTWEMDDCRTYHKLVKAFQEGYKQYT